MAAALDAELNELTAWLAASQRAEAEAQQAALAALHTRTNELELQLDSLAWDQIQLAARHQPQPQQQQQQQRRRDSAAPWVAPIATAAAAAGSAACIDVLAERGLLRAADVLAQEQALLCEAAVAGSLPAVQALLQRVPSMPPDACRRNGAEPLRLACLHGHGALVAWMLDTGAANASDVWAAAAAIVPGVCAGGHTAVLRLLLERCGSALLEQPDTEVPAEAEAEGGQPIVAARALRLACCHGHVDTVQELLEHLQPPQRVLRMVPPVEFIASPAIRRLLQQL